MDLYSYVIARDFGFAPNPFFKFCTLATCKPMIRNTARIGDVIIGVTNSDYAKKIGFTGIVFAMIVTEKISYDQYWNDPRFVCKKPLLNGSLKQFYGDNIYHKENGVIIQENSHHSNDDGSVNLDNYNRDTKSEYVLCSEQFWYWGRSPIKPPEEFSELLCRGRGHRRIKEGGNAALLSSFVSWLYSLGEDGIIDFPAGFNLGFVRYNGK